MADCCFKGFRWNANPKGREDMLAGTSCYITGPESPTAVLILHDLYGWTFQNTRLLADHYAEEVGATVYVPDLFGGEVHSLEILMDTSQWHKLDLPSFMQRNSKSIREPQIMACARTLRSQHKKTGVIGFCYGGWGAFRLGGKGNNLVDCISVAHPTLLETSEIDAVAVPVQILAPDIDPQFTEELKSYSNQRIPSLKLAYNYQFFPGLEHGFATRGNPVNPDEQKGMERSKNAAVFWFRQWLQVA